jgi:toxin ParE1/3/4
MNLRWEESEFVFCDLQAAARYLRRRNPTVARSFLVAAYDTFEFLAQNPGAGRCRADLGYPEVRSWRVESYRNYLIFYREIPNGVQIWRVLHGTQDLPTKLSG